MKEKYTIILFKNKVRYKIVKGYKTLEKAINFFNKKIKENDDVIFEVQTENGHLVNYELALLEKNSENKKPIFKIDELGRNIPIISNDDDFSIIKLEPYKISENVFHVDKKSKINVKYLIETYLKGNSLKLISKLNNKIVIQNDDIFNLFSLKSENDSERFIDSLERYMLENNKNNCIIVKDSDISQKKYLYDILENKGYNKKMLYRKFTTHPVDK